jgi:serine/threonine protein kinase
LVQTLRKRPLLYANTFLLLDYKNKEETKHKGMHNLSGVFLQEENQHEIDGQKFYCFSVVYPKKSRFYYVDNEAEYNSWLKNIRKSIGYANLTDIYEVKEKLGNGKFGLVRLGIHKETQRKVAIKIMSKKDMTNQDLELVKTEIEILKIAQHPYIIRLYDIFENADFIYISKYTAYNLLSYGALCWRRPVFLRREERIQDARAVRREYRAEARNCSVLPPFVRDRPQRSQAREYPDD